MGNKSLSSILLPAIIAAAFLIGGCGDDGPIGPDVPKDYVVYFQTTGSPYNLRSYHILSGKIDSFPVQIPSTGNIAVSPDGSRLYITAGSQTQVLETQTFTTVATIPYGSQWKYGGVVASPDGRWLAIYGYGLVVLDARNYSVMYQDTGDMINGVSSPDSRYFMAGGGPPSAEYVYQLDLRQPPYSVVRKAFPGWVWKVIPSPDNLRWYIYATVGEFAANLYVYDVASDSVLHTQGLGAGYGDMCLSLDATILFFCSPGNGLVGPPNPSAFYAYNTISNKVTETIKTDSLVNQFGDTISQGNQLFSETPDGRNLIVVGGMRNYGSPGFVLFDVDKMAISKCIYLAQQARISKVTCQDGL